MKINQRKKKKFERKFGQKVEFFRLLDDETVLGTIEDLPVQERGSLGKAKTTLTNKRLIVESEVNEDNKGKDKNHHVGRDIFYYETDLDKIESITFYASDRLTKKGNVFLFALFFILAVACVLVNLFLVSEKASNNVSKYGLYVVAVVFALFMIPFRKRKNCARELQLIISSNGSKIEFSDNPDAEVSLVVTEDSVNKLSLLAKGIRQAQNNIRK